MAHIKKIVIRQSEIVEARYNACAAILRAAGWKCCFTSVGDVAQNFEVFREECPNRALDVYNYVKKSWSDPEIRWVLHVYTLSQL